MGSHPATIERADPDGALVSETLAGDHAAFERLVERHRPAVVRVAARVVGRDEAEDVAQETFLRAYGHLPRFQGKSAFKSWLLKIAHNTALNAARRRVPEPVAPDAEACLAASISTLDPAPALEALERREWLMRKLAQLRAEHLVVLVMRDMEGFAYDEIATITNMPLGSVKGRLHRARSELITAMRLSNYDWNLPVDEGSPAAKS